MITKQARKARYEFYNAPLHKKRKCICSPLSKTLAGKYKVKSIPVRKGDTVRVIRGSYKSDDGRKVGRVDTRRMVIVIDKLTVKKADEKEGERPIFASNVEIVKLNLTDPLRRKKLQISEELYEEVKAQEEAEREELAEKAAEATANEADESADEDESEDEKNEEDENAEDSKGDAEPAAEVKDNSEDESKEAKK